jgi:hypothetical protein
MMRVKPPEEEKIRLNRVPATRNAVKDLEIGLNSGPIALTDHNVGNKQLITAMSHEDTIETIKVDFQLVTVVKMQRKTSKDMRDQQNVALGKYSR